MLERTTQLAVLDELLHAARADGRLALVSGEAGAGKSTLVNSFCEMQAAGVRVLIGRCDDLFAPRPLGPLSDIARDVGGPLREAIDGGDQQAAFEAFLDLLESASSPQIVVLEDLQWADDATLDLLRLTARRLDRVRALIIATYRDNLAPDDPLRRALASFTGSAVRRIELPPLSLDAVRTMAADRAIDPVALHRATAGNPFYVVEVLAAERWTIPASVRDAVLARVAQLTTAGRDALAGAAVLGSFATSDAIMAVAECSPSALDDCIIAGLLDDQGTHLAFRHDITRAAVEDSLTPWRRRILHRRALDAFGEQADPALLANHAIGAGESAAVRRWAPMAAAQSAALGANRAAAALYEHAVKHAADAPDAERLGLVEAYARAAERCGDYQSALRAGDEVLAYLRRVNDPLRIGEWLVWISKVSAVLPDKAPSAKARLEALAVLEPLGDTVELASALAELACQSSIWGDVDVAFEAGTRGLAMAEAHGDEPLAIKFLSFMGCAHACSGDPSGFDLYRQAIERAERADDQLGVLRGCNNLGTVYDIAWRPLDALRFLRRALDLASASELSITAPFVLEELSQANLLAGRWDEALACARGALDDVMIDEATRALVVSRMATISARRGQDGHWEQLDEAAAISAPSVDIQIVHPVGIARAEAKWYADDVEAARMELSPLFAVHDARYEPWRRGQLRLWCQRLGIEMPALGPVTTAFDLHVAGQFAGAAAGFLHRGCPFEAADALGDSDTEHELRRSLEILHDLGATARAAQVTKKLRSIGARAIPRGPRPRTRAHASGLTPREAEIAMLLAAGLSNAQIAERLVVSSKTVDHHVSSVLTKLNVSSRRDVGSALAS
jgi:DNA-binding CsgD family transcriptional regulator/tetratricopeptide (TPR) repeat protein